MRILVACEFSGIVRDAFEAKGHYAMSCDFLPSEISGRHYQGDIRDIIGTGWDLMIAFPPCTYLCSSGLHWNKRRPERGQMTEEALDFVRLLLDCSIPQIALENPIGCISSKIRKPDQIIQPWQFGHDASKSTCLWLKNLPLLKPTNVIEATVADGKKRYANQMPDGQNGERNPVTGKLYGWNTPEIKLSRSRTFKGIAAAMADQWG